MDPFTPLASLYIYSNAFVSMAVIRFIGISSLAAAIASNHRESTSEKKTCAGTRNSYCCWRLFLLVPPPLMFCYSATVWPSGIPAFLITDARPRRFAKSSFFNTFFLSFEHFLWPAIWCWISFVRSGAREIGEETRRKKFMHQKWVMHWNWHHLRSVSPWPPRLTMVCSTALFCICFRYFAEWNRSNCIQSNCDHCVRASYCIHSRDFFCFFPKLKKRTEEVEEEKNTIVLVLFVLRDFRARARALSHTRM